MALVAKGSSADTCTKNTEEWDCAGAQCSAQDGTEGYCVWADWVVRWQEASREYVRVRNELTAMAQSVENPLGVSESDLPLFFGDLTGTNSRFFASSDYLLSTWAVSAVQSAQAAFENARSAWVQRRNATIQDELNEQEKERRIEAINTKYGEIIAENCGLDPTLSAVDVLKKIGDKAPIGHGDPCYINKDLKDKDGWLVCTTTGGAGGKGGSLSYQQCVDEKMRIRSLPYLVNMRFYSVGQTGPSRACRNHYRYNPSDKTDATIKVRVRGAPLGHGPNSTGVKMKLQGYTEIVGQAPDIMLKGCNYDRAYDKSGHLSETGREFNFGNLMLCGTTQSGGVKCRSDWPRGYHQEVLEDSACACRTDVTGNHGQTGSLNDLVTTPGYRVTLLCHARRGSERC